MSGSPSVVPTDGGLLLLDAPIEGEIAVAGAGSSATVARTATGAIGLLSRCGSEAVVVWPAHAVYVRGGVRLNGTTAALGAELPPEMTVVDPDKNVGDVDWIHKALGQDASNAPLVYVYD